MNYSGLSEIGNVDLIKLKAQKLFEDRDFNVVLSNDIWNNNALIVRKGGFLTETLVNKLLNFGIRRISVNFIKKNSEEDNASQLIKDFARNQYVLIISKELSEIKNLVHNLLVVGFSEENIFITADPNTINKYFGIKKINFIFSNFQLYCRYCKCIEKYTLLKDVHAVITFEDIEKFKHAENKNKYRINFIKKNFSSKLFQFIINRALNENLLNFYQEKSMIS